MKKQIKYFGWTVMVLLVTTLSATAQRKKAEQIEVIRTNADGMGREIVVTVTPGEAHNHPMMAIWIEDTAGNYLQTLFVNESVAKGYFNYAQQQQGKWQPGELVRPASLPVWAHKRNIKNTLGNFMPTAQSPVPDAYSGATPPAGFTLISRSDKPLLGKVVILMEINQSWDWNEYWTNNKFPDDADYKSSAQPSVVYAAAIDMDSSSQKIVMTPIGHGHYAGSTGELFVDLTTLTTARQIVQQATVEVN
ncbi:MAG: hypothetical protein EOM83_11690 [Clostridia bacterium]|nr:hypothetical protein [Clostridia bacterium]